MEDTPVDDGRIRFLGSFLCPSLEQDFRRTHFREGVRLALGCSVAALVASVLYLVNGYRLYGTSTPFLMLVGVRSAIFAASLGLILTLRRCKSPARVDRALAAWCLVVAAGNLTAIATRSCGNLGQALMSLGVPLVTYCILPLPLAGQLLLALPFSLAALLVAFGTGVDSITLFTLGGTCLIANAIGSFASWQLNHRRRQVYLAGVRETELRCQLQQALAEIKTLRGWLSICAWCKRIRDEAQAWQPVESYVKRHSHAEFSHGICERCVREHFGETALRQG